MKKILLSCTLGATLLLAAGCNKDYLETAPTDQVDNSAIFQSVENATTALNGIYRYMFERTNAVSSNVQNKPGVGGILLGLDFISIFDQQIQHFPKLLSRILVTGLPVQVKVTGVVILKITR